MPARNAAHSVVEGGAPRAVQEVWLRLRHPTSAPIREVTVNGQEWDDFDPAREVVTLYDLKDNVNVRVKY